MEVADLLGGDLHRNLPLLPRLPDTVTLDYPLELPDLQVGVEGDVDGVPDSIEGVTALELLVRVPSDLKLLVLGEVGGLLLLGGWGGLLERWGLYKFVHNISVVWEPLLEGDGDGYLIVQGEVLKFVSEHGEIRAKLFLRPALGEVLGDPFHDLPNVQIGHGYALWAVVYIGCRYPATR